MFRQGFFEIGVFEREKGEAALVPHLNPIGVEAFISKLKYHNDVSHVKSVFFCTFSKSAWLLLIKF